MSKVTAKFQITIPHEVRTEMNIMPGVEMGFKKEKNRYYLTKNPKVNPIEKWRGAIKSKMCSDEMMKNLRGYGVESID